MTNDDAIEAEKLYRMQQLSWGEQGKIAEAEATLIRNSNRRVRCAIHQSIDENYLTMGCPHITPGTQDPVNPVGMVAMPKHYYVCKTCFQLIEKKRFKWPKEIRTCCWGCVMDFADSLLAKNPDLLVDLTAKEE